MDLPHYRRLQKALMKVEDINRIMIVHGDPDYMLCFQWIGRVILQTIEEGYPKVLKDSETIEGFVQELLPLSIQVIQDCGYTREEAERRSKQFEDMIFKYNFEYMDSDWEFGGHETLIIDLENNRSFIR